LRGACSSGGRPGKALDHPNTGRKAKETSHASGQDKSYDGRYVLSDRGTRHTDAGQERRQITMKKLDKSSHDPSTLLTEPTEAKRHRERHEIQTQPIGPSFDNTWSAEIFPGGWDFFATTVRSSVSITIVGSSSGVCFTQDLSLGFAEKPRYENGQLHLRLVQEF